MNSPNQTARARGIKIGSVVERTDRTRKGDRFTVTSFDADGDPEGVNAEGVPHEAYANSCQVVVMTPDLELEARQHVRNRLVEYLNEAVMNGYEWIHEEADSTERVDEKTLAARHRAIEAVSNELERTRT